MGLKRVWEFVPKAGKKRVKVNSDSRFWQFHQKGVAGGHRVPCGNMGRAYRRQSRGGGGETGEETVESAPTCLRWESERPKDSASLWETPMILNAFVSTA